MVQHDVVATLPGNDAVTGSLAISAVTDHSIGGTLTLQTDAAKVVLYFFCDR
jgi:hypothetical protein